MAIVRIYSGSTIIEKTFFRTMQVGEWISNYDDVDLEMQRNVYVTHFSVDFENAYTWREQLDSPRMAYTGDIIRFPAGDLRVETGVVT